MIIRTITCHNVNNFGASLQAWALCEYLHRQGHDVKVIDFINQAPIPGTTPPQRSRKRAIIEHPILRPIGRTIERWRQRYWTPRWRRFGKFLQLIPQTERYTSLEELRKNPPEADLYIAGSDQIWNVRAAEGNNPAYFLDFGHDNTRRASYAASFASSTLPDGTADIISERLKRLDYISVRESSGLDILNSLGHKGTLVVDPVFLIPRTDWDTLADKSEVKGHGKYILLYAFDAGELIMRTARKISRATGWPIISVTPRRLSGVSHNCPIAGPLEFLSLARGASLILSESFHALAFGMIFNVPFFAFQRKENLNARLTDFLSTLGLSDRLVTTDSTPLPLTMDFSKPEAILSKLRDESVAYLDRITAP